MPKLKTHSGAAKRFSKTGTGKIKRGQTKTRHILTSKPQKSKRKLGKQKLVSDGDYLEGSAHDSLRLRRSAPSTLWTRGVRMLLTGQDRIWPPPSRKLFRAARDQA